MDYKKLRDKMVLEQLANRDIDDPQVLEAFMNVPRHLFVPEDKRRSAYEDYPLPIGEGQTISQPYMVALMTQHLRVRRGMKVLEIGTGSGYQAAILYYIGVQLYSVEVIPFLARRAHDILDSLNYKAEITTGDGSLGWEEHALYDRIIVTAASPVISPCWQEQLKTGGRMVVPLGDSFHQSLTVVEKVSGDEVREKRICGCIFVPLVGKHGYKE